MNATMAPTGAPTDAPRNALPLSMNQQVVSMMVYLFLYVVLLCLYVRVDMPNYRVSMVPLWTDITIVTSALMLMVMFALHTYYDVSACREYVIALLFAGSVLVSTQHMKWLRAYFALYQQTYEVRWRISAVIISVYKSRIQSALLWMASISFLLAAGIYIADHEHAYDVPGAPYCLVLKTPKWGIIAYFANLAVMLLEVFALLLLRKMYLVTTGLILNLVFYISCLGGGFLTYHMGNVTLPYTSMTPWYFFTMLYLYSLLMTFLLPVWKAGEMGRVHFYYTLRYHCGSVTTMFDAMCSWKRRRTRVTTIEPRDDSVSAFSNIPITDMPEAYSEVKPPEINWPESLSAERAIPVIHQYLMSAFTRRFDLMGVTRARAPDVSVAMLQRAVVIHNEFVRIAHYTGTRRYLELYRYIIGMQALSGRQHDEFARCLTELRRYIAENSAHLHIPENCTNVLNESAEPNPGHLYPLQDFLEKTLHKALSYMNSVTDPVLKTSSEPPRRNSRRRRGRRTDEDEAQLLDTFNLADIDGEEDDIIYSQEPAMGRDGHV